MTYTDLDPPRHSGGHRSFGGPHSGRSSRFSDASREDSSGDRFDSGSDRSFDGGFDRGFDEGRRFASGRGGFGERISQRLGEAGRGWSVGRTLRQAEAWLDERGRGAWIAAMVLGFVLVWPVGLALLFYMIWSKRMFRTSCSRRSAHDDSRWMNRRHGFRSSGNSAFDAYKADTLRRLEDEQEAFESFLERLRAAKDKTEFDEFMDERVARAREEAVQREEAGADAPVVPERPR